MANKQHREIPDIESHPTISDDDGDTKIQCEESADEDIIRFDINGVEQFTIQSGKIEPFADDTLDLGSSSLEFKDLYIDGTAYIDAATITTATITTATISEEIINPQIADPTLSADQCAIYSKDISAGNAAPFIKCEGGTVFALTVPAGLVLPFIPGYFGDGSNGSYTNALGAGNTVAEVNAYLNPIGWHVCDGTELNHTVSPIFNGAGRYLPQLTDDRFLMGDTVVGVQGGSNVMSDHLHTGTAASDGVHTHNISGGLASDGSGADPVVGVVTVNTNAVTLPSEAHTHTVSVGSGTNPSGGTLENRPKYLPCYYIMKVV